MRGIPIWGLMRATAAADSSSGTATRTMSQPASSSRRIWATVAATSAVSVLVIDWTEITDPPPTATLPTLICRVSLR